VGPEQQRRTGAGSFVGSTTEQNDFAIARNLAVTGFQLLGGNTERARNRVSFRGVPVPQIHEQYFGAAPHLTQQFVGANPRDGELP
jgi:hypothetical protein